MEKSKLVKKIDEILDSNNSKRKETVYDTPREQTIIHNISYVSSKGFKQTLTLIEYNLSGTKEMIMGDYDYLPNHIKKIAAQGYRYGCSMIQENHVGGKFFIPEENIKELLDWNRLIQK